MFEKLKFIIENLKTIVFAGVVFWLLAISGWPLLLQYGYGGLGTSIGITAEQSAVLAAAGLTIADLKALLGLS